MINHGALACHQVGTSFAAIACICDSAASAYRAFCFKHAALAALHDACEVHCGALQTVCASSSASPLKVQLQVRNATVHEAVPDVQAATSPAHRFFSGLLGYTMYL